MASHARDGQAGWVETIAVVAHRKFQFPRPVGESNSDLLAAKMLIFLPLLDQIVKRPPVFFLETGIDTEVTVDNGVGKALLQADGELVAI